MKMISYDLDAINDLNWESFRDGVEQFQFPSAIPAQADGPSARLLRYKTNAKVPFHSHPGYEHIITLSGSQTDRSGTSKRGTVVINKPQSGHSLLSDEGCIVLAIYEKSVCFCSESSYLEAKHPDEYIVVQNIFDENYLTNLIWTQVKDGIEQHILYDSDKCTVENKPSARLIKLESNTTICKNISKGWRYVLYPLKENNYPGLLEIYPPGSCRLNSNLNNKIGKFALLIEVF